MKLLVFTQGIYGERILDNVCKRAPQHWIIIKRRIPEFIPSIVENPEKIVNRLNLDKGWDLVLFLGESPSAFSLLPTILKKVSPESVIAPVDNYSWLPLGLERQIRFEVEKYGTKIIFPRTFCTLSTVGVPSIDEFSSLLGSPKLEIIIEEGIIKRVQVLRGAPCGSTWFVAEKLPGSKVDEVIERSAIIVQIFPCLASRKIERIFSDAPIHIAARLISKEVKRALERNNEYKS